MEADLQKDPLSTRTIMNTPLYADDQFIIADSEDIYRQEYLHYKT